MNYQVVHSIAGRLRIRIPRLQWDPEFASTLTWLIESLPNVASVRINPAASSLVVVHNCLSSTALCTEVETCIYKVTRPSVSSQVGHHLTDSVVSADSVVSLPSDPLVVDATDRQELAQPVMAVTTSESTPEIDLEPEVNHWQDLRMPVLSLGVALLAAPLEIPTVLVGVAIAGAALPWFMRAADSLVNHHQPNIDLLDSLWMSLQTVQGNYAAPALKTCLVEVRRSLRGTTAEIREQEALELLTWFEQPIRVDREGQVIYVSGNKIQAGDLIQVQAGERIPADGWVLQGTALVDEHPLSADSSLVLCNPGQEVYAATRVTQGQLSILAQRGGVNSRMGLAAHLIQLMPVHDTQLGVHQAELVRAVIFPTIAFGGAMFALTGNFGAAVSPFQFDFGSGVPISVHTTLLSALTYAARCGIYIRSARVLESLSQVDAVVLDQAGIQSAAPTGEGRLGEGSASPIAALSQQGVAVYWTTPDPLPLASQQATELGIPLDRTWANATTEQTTHLVSALRHHGKTVAVVGSSASSTILAQANLSISVSTDQPVSQVVADVVLLGDALESLVYAITIAKRAMAVVYQNTAIVVVPNLLIQIVGGMMVGVNPIVNVMINNGSAFVAEFIQGTRPLFDQPPPDTLRPHPSRPALPEILPPRLPLPERSLKQRELAKRLQVTSQALTSQRSKPQFPHWTQRQDPEGQAWQYDATTQLFYGV